ncbi:MAG: NAD+ synthase [Proteobacteria bacterium]|nr:NAD+ synthase [Pseudomonadota bacterium]
MLTIWAAQRNPVMGDLQGNLAIAREELARAESQNADLLVLPELFICGYPPEDLLLKADFVDACMAAVHELAASVRGHTAVLIGSPWIKNGKLYNGAALIRSGSITDVALKTELPNYGVFDEKRYFQSANDVTVVPLNGIAVGIAICEDLWFPRVCAALKAAGAEVIVSPNASPYVTNKPRTREDVVRDRVNECGLPILYVNQWGGQDELVFDGRSFAMNPGGNIVHLQKPWTDAAFKAVLTKAAKGYAFDAGINQPQPGHWEDIYLALVTGTRDYVNKNGFPGVLIGLSGGIDSSIVAAIAVDALGADRVEGILMPSPFSSDHSLSDAHKLAEALGIHTRTIAIAPAMEAYTKMVSPDFDLTTSGLTEENIQARIRGMLLMAYSNKYGHMVLTTGNKSEMSVGYATLYGDMNGGYNPIKDIYKTSVYELCKWRNSRSVVIPQNVLDKPPSAELRPGQKDEDSLPPYAVLDKVLRMLIEQRKGRVDIVAAGVDAAVVDRVIRLLRGAEYKRRQSAPGVKVTDVAFGKDFRYPIVNRYRSQPKD